MADAIHFKLAIVGVRDTIRALQQLDPEAAKVLKKELGDAAKLVQAAAKARVPQNRPLLGGSGGRLQSGWRNVWPMRGRVRGGEGWPAWFSSEIKSAIKVTTAASDRDRRTRTRVKVQVFTQSAAGSIYEFARRDHTPGDFSTRLPAYRGGRIMWAAHDSVDEKVQRKIMDAMDVANRRIIYLLENTKV